MSGSRGRPLLKIPAIEVIELFQNSSGDKKKEAFFELVLRFRKELLDYCEIRCMRFNQPPEVAEQISEDTFDRYAKKGKFDINKANRKSVEDAFTLYLFSIANRLLTDFYRAQKKKEQGLFYDGTEAIITKLPPCPPDLELEEQLKYQIITSLPYKHRVIFLTYSLHEKEGCRMPPHLLHELREHLELSQHSIRVYKKEAKDKVTTALDAFNFKGDG